jgi:hypothetical protein
VIDQRIDAGFVSGDRNDDGAVRRIPNVTGKIERASSLIDEPPEADPLHHSRDPDLEVRHG